MAVTTSLADINLSAVKNGLEIFIDGNGEVDGLKGSLRDVQATKAHLQATSDILGNVGEMKHTADAVEKVSSGIQDALKLVSKLGSLTSSICRACPQSTVSATSPSRRTGRTA